MVPVEEEHEEDDGQHHEEEDVLGGVLPADEAARVSTEVVAVHGHRLGRGFLNIMWGITILQGVPSIIQGVPSELRPWFGWL